MAYREAAYALNAYIESAPSLIFDPPFLSEEETGRPLTILELGSGTGIVAKTCADRLADRGDIFVIVTDLPEVCPLLEQNLQHEIAASARPSAPKVLVRPLTWGSKSQACNIATELGYLPSSQQEISSSPQYITRVICSDLVRPIHPQQLLLSCAPQIPLAAGSLWRMPAGIESDTPPLVGFVLDISSASRSIFPSFSLRS